MCGAWAWGGGGAGAGGGGGGGGGGPQGEENLNWLHTGVEDPLGNPHLWVEFKI